MSIIASCGGRTAGLNVLSCYSAAAEYLPGYAILMLVFLILYFRLEIEPTRDRLAAVMLVTSIVALLFAAAELIPEQAWSVTLVLAIGSGAILAIRRY